MFQIVKERLEIEAPSLELQAPQSLLLDTLRMARRLESSSQVEAERQSQASAEPWLVLSLEVAELTNLSVKLVMYGTR